MDVTYVGSDSINILVHLRGESGAEGKGGKGTHDQADRLELRFTHHLGFKSYIEICLYILCKEDVMQVDERCGESYLGIGVDFSLNWSRRVQSRQF